MARASHIVIAGAGAVGSTCAYELARAGRRVTVVDPAPVGANASGVAAGMLAPAFEALFEAAPIEHYERLLAARDRWPALAQALGITLRRAGAMAVGTRAQTERWAADFASLGVAAKQLSPGQASERAALLAPGPWGVLCDADWRLEALAALAALRLAAEAQGANFIRRRILAFDRGLARLEGQAPIAADWLLIATGASRSLEPVAPELAGLSPVKGHILRARWRGSAGPVLRAPGVYICPDEAEVLLGASMEAGIDDTRVDVDVVATLKARGAAIAPALAALDWDAAVGVRAATPDGWPLAGRSRAPGVALAVGARRNGWLLAPLIAEVVRDVIEDRSPGETGACFDPARFSRG